MAALTAAVVLWLLVRTGDIGQLFTFGAIPLLFAAAVWAVFDRPYVRVSDGGVEIGNVLRTVRIPWPAVTGVELRWGLRVVTVRGGYTAWSVPPPSRPGLLGSGRGAAAAPAAQQVVDRWTALKDAGYLDDPRVEADVFVSRWNRPSLIVLATLLVLSVAGLLIGPG